MIYAERPVPSVARRLPVHSFSSIGASFGGPYPGIVIGIQDNEKGVAPFPGIIILAIGVASDRFRQRVLVSGVEIIGNRIREIFLSGFQPHDCQRLVRRRENVIEIPAFLVLVIAKRQEHRDGTAEDLQIGTLNPVGRIGFGFGHSGPQGGGIHCGRIAEIDVEIGLVVSHVKQRLLIQGFLIRRLPAILAQMRIGYDGKGKCAAGRFAGAKRMLVTGDPGNSADFPIKHLIIVSSVGLQPVEDRFNRLVGA